MSSKQQMYAQAADLVAHGWTQKKYCRPSDPFAFKGTRYCLVGAVMQAEGNGAYAETPLDPSTRRELNQQLQRFWYFQLILAFQWFMSRVKWHQFRATPPAELWNDAFWRQQSTVLRVLRDLEYSHSDEFINSLGGELDPTEEFTTLR